MLILQIKFFLMLKSWDIIYNIMLTQIGKPNLMILILKTTVNLIDIYTNSFILI